MTAVAGEVADGLIVHPFNSRAFLERELLPALEQGRARGGRTARRRRGHVPGVVATGSHPPSASSR
jgi:hypothetical protein